MIPHTRLISLLLFSWKHILYLHTQNFRLLEHFLFKYFSVSPIKLVPYWSHASCITIRKTYVKKLSLASPKTPTKKRERRRRKMKGNCRAFCVLRKRKRKRKKKNNNNKNKKYCQKKARQTSQVTSIRLSVVNYFAKSSILDTEWKVSVFGVFLVRIFPHLDWIRRDTFRIQSKSGKKRARIRTLFTQWDVWLGSEYAPALKRRKGYRVSSIFLDNLNSCKLTIHIGCLKNCWGKNIATAVKKNRDFLKILRCSKFVFSETLMVKNALCLGFLYVDIAFPSRVSLIVNITSKARYFILKKLWSYNSYSLSQVQLCVNILLTIFDW